MADAVNTFPHRKKRDGTYDSYCLTCFTTIANAKTEEELVDHDRNHVCESSFLADRGHLRRPHSI